MKTTVAVILALGLATPLLAQTTGRANYNTDDTPGISFRPFLMLTEQSFDAKTTFEAIFGQSTHPFWGGGLQVAFKDGTYVEASASRFRKTGERVYRYNGQAFRLGIPLTATITPVEISAGYRLKRWRHVRPYVGAGLGSYAYKETSQFAESSENLEKRHLGYLVHGGVEFRPHRWIGVGADAQYTRVSGILGSEGVSSEAGEKNLGGTAVRLRMLIGR